MLVMTMSVFVTYSKYYNLLYRDKDYESEADFVYSLIQKHTPDSRSILDLGCGTGRHDVFLAQKGYSVTGVDFSKEMIALGQSSLASLDLQQSALNFLQGDIRTIRLDQQFDAVISLFHVMSYQTTNEDLKAAFITAKDHLAPGGMFIFDFWYGPAVVTNRPVVRVKRMEDSECKVIRIAEPVMYPNQNVVDVNYTVWVRDKSTDKVEEIRETHKMRYWFMPEVNFFVKEAGFNLLEAGEWMTGDKPSFESWGVYVVVQG